MPRYLYRCETCGNETELQCAVADRDQPVWCPCDPRGMVPSMQRVLTTAAVKVEGFNAKNGYSNAKTDTPTQ